MMDTEYEYVRLVDLLGKVYSGRANLAETNELMAWLDRKHKQAEIKALTRYYQPERIKNEPEPPAPASGA